MNWARDHIRVSLIVSNQNANMTPWKVINFSRLRNLSSMKTRKNISFIELESSVIRYDETFIKMCKIPFEESRTVLIARDMESKNVLDTKSTSTYKQYPCVEKVLVRLKYFMEGIKTIPQFGIGKDYSQRGMKYFDSGIIMESMQTPIIYPLDAAEAYFGSP